MRYSIQGVVGELTTLPGCSQIGVSHGVFIPKSLRNKGLGTRANIARQSFAFDELGYDALLCTVVSTNLGQKKVLEKTGWECISYFTSSNSGNDIELWIKKKGLGI